MPTKIFVNLPVKDLQASIAFFTAIGYTFNKQFSDETGTCMIVSEDIFVMLLTHKKFQGFIPGGISDATKSSEVLVALNCESREAVQEMMRKAVAAGAKIFREANDHGFMYEHAFQDLDGHIWEYFWMNPDHIQ